ncbi:MAG: hypothetical protein K9H64_22865, partial [Bacteroidales bacterium]|nr:hypothetical protein [Bacteroidales bacterium]MCF8458881.1 hypothetical protein [Bacteroidales bacterium]
MAQTNQIGVYPIQIPVFGLRVTFIHINLTAMRLLTFLLFFLIINTGFSQLVFEDITSLTTGNSHLLSNNVHQVLKDNSDNLWIQFYEGLAKYDGQNWEYFTPGNSSFPEGPCEFGTDSNNNIWISGYQVILKYDGTNWTTFSNPGFTALNSNNCCADTSGNMYFGTSHNGVVKFTDSVYVFLNNSSIGLHSDDTQCTYIDNQQNLWVGHYDGISVFDGTNCSIIYASTYGGGIAGSITQDTYGNIWIPATDGIRKYDGNTWTYYNLAQMFGLSIVHVRKLSSDNNGGLWCNTENEGVYHFDGTNWSIYDNGQGLNTNCIRNICCGSDGKVWVCTCDMGIDLYENQQWTYWNSLEGLSNNRIMSIACATDGSLWLGTDYGTSRYDDSNWTNYKYRKHEYIIWSIDNGIGDKLWFGGNCGNSSLEAAYYLDSNWVEFAGSFALNILRCPVYQTLEESGNITWFATDKALNRMEIIPNLDPQWTVYRTQDGLLNNEVRAVLRDYNGDLVIGTWGGINKFDGTFFTVLPLPAGEVLSEHITSLLEDHQNQLWVGTTNGLGIYDGQGWTIVDTTSGLADNYVNALYQSTDYHIWVATKNGISRYDGSTFTSYYKSDGLIADNITDIVEDQQNNMYFSSLYGVS